MLGLGLYVALVVMLCFAAGDTIAKKVSEKIGSKRATLIMIVASFIPILIGVYFYGLTKLNYATIIFGAATGFTYALAFFLLYKSLETEHVSNTISLNGIEYMMISGFSILVLGESVTWVQLLCFVGVLAGAFLVTTTKKFVFNRGYIPAIAAMVVFAVSYFFAVYALQSSGGVLLPALISRVAAILLMLVFIRLSPDAKKFRNVRLASDRKTLAQNTIMGIFYGSGSVLLLSLATLNFVAIGSIIVASEPALVILLGYMLYKERFAAHQVVGFVLLIASILILSAL